MELVGPNAKDPALADDIRTYVSVVGANPRMAESLGEIATLDPEPGEGRGQLQPRAAAFRIGQTPIQCGPQIVMFTLQPVQPGDLIRFLQFRFSTSNQLAEEAEMAVPYAFSVTMVYENGQQRFFETSQFKRSALPNAPRVGSGGSLSPRSDWRAPSAGHADASLQELEREVPDGQFEMRHTRCAPTVCRTS
jgi:hypothetical protein